jgi:hypothetical protein
MYVAARLGDEPCVDLDGHGLCHCVPAEPDLLRIDRRHMVVHGVNADGTAHTSKRYFQL